MKTPELKSAEAAHRNVSDIIPGDSISKPGSKFGTISKRFHFKWFTFLAPAFMLYACNNSDQLVKQYKDLHIHDSLMVLKTQSDDSAIKGYIGSMNEIQSNLDEIKVREKLISVQGKNEGGEKSTTIADIKAIDNLILKSNKQIADLQAKLKKMNVKDAGLEAMVARMNTQITQKDSEIAVLQTNLTRVNASYASVTEQFNDSVGVLHTREAKITDMTNTMHTVYYAVGTTKELKDNKVITKTGGFIGIGKSTELTPDQSTAYFTKTDLTKLSVIPLNAKFKKLLTTHPAESYKITGDKKADSLVITDQSSFWSENKFLVVAVK